MPFERNFLHSVELQQTTRETKKSFQRRISRLRPTPASNFAVATGESAIDSVELPFFDDMLTSVDPQPIRSVAQEKSTLSVSATGTMPQSIDQFMTNSRDVAIDSIDPALPSSSGLTLDSVGSPNFSWDERNFMNEVWLFTPLDVEHLNFLENLDHFPSEDPWWPSDNLSSVPDSNDRIDFAIGMMRDHFQQRSGVLSPIREEQKQLWYSAPPHLQIYDEEVVNVFLNLGRTHLSSIFPVFSDFEAKFGTNEELCLAMAAVGALFCTVKGSYKVAKTLYNDARRMHLETFFRTEYVSFDAALDSTKTFILLALYGICSGDKRSYEFFEVFYASTLHTAEICRSLSNESTSSSTDLHLLRLSEAIQMMESLRVIITFRPPSFMSTIDVEWQSSEGRKDYQTSWLAELKSIMSPGGISNPLDSDVRGVVAMSTYSWMASPRGRELSPHQNLWKQEFIELALDRWVRGTTISSPPGERLDLPQKLLYHLTHINLHSNLELIQRLAHEIMKSPQSYHQGDYSRSVPLWVNGDHFRISRWHAETILNLVKETQAVTRRRFQTQKDHPVLPEPPHLPYCIYYATLVTWYGILVGNGQPCALDAHLDTSVQLLFSLKAHVSGILGRTLCELLSDES